LTADERKRLHGEQVSEKRQPYQLTGSGLRLMCTGGRLPASAECYPGRRRRLQGPRTRAVWAQCRPRPPFYDAYLALVNATDDARRQRNLVASRMKIEAAKMTPEVRAEVIAQGKALKASVTSFEGRLAQAESVFVAKVAKLPDRICCVPGMG